MSIHLQREMEKLKKQLLSLCAVVEEQVQMAIEAFLEQDDVLAAEVRRRDTDVDRREVEIEEECLKSLALHQPVATDLRLIVAALKINNDLEQIGDLAVNIAKKSAGGQPAVDVPFDIAGMWRKVQTMLRDSLDALVNMDVRLAEDVCVRDDEVDHMKRQIRERVESIGRRQSELTAGLLNVLAVSRNLERIADYSVSIAEDVIYMVRGVIVRHRDQESQPALPAPYSRDSRSVW